MFKGGYNNFGGTEDNLKILGRMRWLSQPYRTTSVQRVYRYTNSLASTGTGAWCTRKNDDCHNLFNCVIKLNEYGTHIAPCRGSGAPHMNFNSHVFFDWANLLKINCAAIAP